MALLLGLAAPLVLDVAGVCLGLGQGKLDGSACRTPEFDGGVYQSDDVAVWAEVPTGLTVQLVNLGVCNTG